MEARHALLQRLGDITNAIERLESDDFAGRCEFEKAADQVRSALSELDDADTVAAEWEAQAVRTLEETELDALTVNIDTCKEPGS